MSKLQQQLAEKILKASQVISNTKTITHVPAAYLLVCDDKEFISRWDDKSGSYMYYGSSTTIDEVNKRAKSLGLNTINAKVPDTTPDNRSEGIS